jgi:hypothetical protein
MPDPDIVAHAIVDAIGDPSAPLFIPVAEDTAELRRRLFGLHELQRREASFAEVVSDLEW